MTRTMDISVEVEPTRLVAVVRERVAMDSLAAFYDRAYGLVVQEVTAAGLAITGPAFGWYLDGDVHGACHAPRRVSRSTGIVRDVRCS